MKHESPQAAQIAALEAEIKRLQAVITEEAAQLRKWAVKSRQGGWSTHQVDPMRRRADYLDEVLAGQV